MPTIADICRNLLLRKLESFGHNPDCVCRVTADEGDMLQAKAKGQRLKANVNSAHAAAACRLQPSAFPRTTAEIVRTLCASPDGLRARWADARQRNFSLSASTGEKAGVRCRKLQLAERGILFASVAAQTGQTDADLFALLCHLALNAPVLTRKQRAEDR